MSRRVLFFVVGVGLMAPMSALAQEKKDPATPPAAKPPADKPGAENPPAPTAPPAGMPPGELTPEMKAAMEAIMPGLAHQKLAKLAGDWTVKVKLTAPGAPPEESEASSKIMMVLDGRFLHEDYTGTMMGMPFRSNHVLGYNNGSKKYEGTWVYSMGTSIMNLKGASTDDGKTITCEATFDNESGVRETMTITYKFADDDHFTVSLDAGKMPDGTAGPVMEMAYTRKK